MIVTFDGKTQPEILSRDHGPQQASDFCSVVQLGISVLQFSAPSHAHAQFPSQSAGPHQLPGGATTQRFGFFGVRLVLFRHVPEYWLIQVPLQLAVTLQFGWARPVLQVEQSPPPHIMA